MDSNLAGPTKTGVQLTLVLIYLGIIGFFTFISAGSSIPFDVEDQAVVGIMKITQSIMVIILFILPALLFAVIFRPERFQFFQLNIWPSIKQIVLGCLCIVAALPLINFLAGLNEQMEMPKLLADVEQWMRTSEANAKTLTEAFMVMDSPLDLAANIFVIAIMAAVSEELFFRGLLQNLVLEKTNKPHLAIWVSAILFSAYHVQFYGFIPRMLLGALLGYFFYWSKSLWLPILVHFANNAAAVLVLFFIGKGQLPKDMDTIGVRNEELEFVLLSTAAVFGLLYLLYKSRPNALNPNTH